MNAFDELRGHGQTTSLDYIHRGMLDSGELARLVNEEGLGGVTSNPKIFKEAMTEGDDYDGQIQEVLARDPGIAAGALYELLAVSDIQRAADVFRPLYDRTDGDDGFASFEVSPHLADDTDRTIDEARRLWSRVNRPNVYIKVPGTPAGIPAIEKLLVDGINVNVTLMFSREQYRAVSGAHLRALRSRERPGAIRSVASIFLSRIDAAVDDALDRIGTAEARRLHGTIGVAVGKQIYRDHRAVVDGEALARERRRGARPQKILWASTSVKNPKYRDVMYIEELVGPDSVVTMPPKTMAAFRDHGRVRGDTALEEVASAAASLQALADLGIELEEIQGTLLQEGIQKFSRPFDALLEALEDKRRELLAA